MSEELHRYNLENSAHTLVGVHSPNIECYLYGCCIHALSDHHMRGWEQVWCGKMERICPHGVGHPDPDALAWAIRKGFSNPDVHGCDGCCIPPSS